MTQAHELRLGNWINLGLRDDIKNYGKVLSIGSVEQEFEQVYCECEESFEWAFKNNYCGIPLTPEILEKCGFDNDDNDFLKTIDERSSLHINLQKQRTLIESYDGIIKLNNIKHLHQLQNLHFALTEEELVINLFTAE